MVQFKSFFNGKRARQTDLNLHQFSICDSSESIVLVITLNASKQHGHIFKQHIIQSSSITSLICVSVMVGHLGFDSLCFDVVSLELAFSRSRKSEPCR